MEERRAIGRLRALLRATEQMKAAQKTSNNSGIIYYEINAQEYDAIIPTSHMTPLFLGDRIIKIELTFTTQTTVAVRAVFATSATAIRWRVHK